MKVASAIVILGGVGIGLVALVALHLLPTGLSPIRNAVSEYGISRYRLGYRVQTLAYGVAGVGAALGSSSLPGSTTAAVALCALFAASRLAISWFPMDEPGTGSTRTGRRHGLLALAAFGGIDLAAEALRALLRGHHAWSGYAASSRVLAILMLVSFIGMGVARRAEGGRYFGLVERAFYLCMTAWLALVASLLVSAS